VHNFQAMKWASSWVQLQFMAWNSMRTLNVETWSK